MYLLLLPPWFKYLYIDAFINRYYACLCGHQDVVEYLIGVGARCEANTFDGERCLYGALTDDIRRILTHHNLVSTHMIRREAYDEFLRR